MFMPKHIRQFYEFGPFRLDPEKHRLLRDGEPVPLSPKSVEALMVLVQNAGKLMEREALMQAVWADTFVEDANLTVAISHLRKALGQSGETAEYIETIPRVGYRFVAEVREITDQRPPLIVEKHTLSQTVIEEEFLGDEPQGSEKTGLVAVPSSERSLTIPLSRRSVALLAFALLGTVTLGTSVYLNQSQRITTAAATGPGAASIRSIAVLPLKSLSGEAENAPLSLGMADALISRLGAIRRVVVRPTSSIVRYAGGNQDPIVAGRALGVDAVLEGTLQHDKGRTRIDLRLLDTSSGIQLWASTFDELDADIFTMQDSVSREVAQALFSALSQNEKAALTRHPTINADAYALYLQGDYFWSKRAVEAAKSIDYFRKAIGMDPNFAQAYASLAAVEATGGNPSPEAEALTEKALQLDDTLAEAHATLAFIKMFHHWDWATAERELDRAIELNPNSSVAHHWKGVYLSIRGRLNEAKVEMNHALELDPLSLVIMADIGQLHYFAHEYDQALDYCNRALALDPEFWPAHEYLLDIYLAKGMDQEALNELLNLDYRYNTAAAKQRIREVFTRGGIRTVLTQQLNSYLNRTDAERIPITIARFYSRLRDNEHALYWLDRAVNGQRFFSTAYISVDPLFEPLRDEAPFKAILNRMGLQT
ncbi:MAG TPA: winged helix-turn-helix domain-containing protein [Pyrinomonadaceae bacterium]|nr:winged helix-turn-helix domain-containing protein [Pyrinomonadaceae bacterium]